jgi:hypothetical protein
MPQFADRIRVVCAGLWVALLACRAGGETIIDSRNASAAPASFTWAVDDAGWTYTPASSYLLSGILTEFASNGGGISKTVTEEVYSGDPAAGGALLASAPFTATEGTFVGASLGPVPLVAGHEYFVGFKNVRQLGTNYTSDPGATRERHFGYDTDGSGSYGSSAGLPGDPVLAPILQFESVAAPLPGSFCAGMLLTAAMGLWRVRIRCGRN